MSTEAIDESRIGRLNDNHGSLIGTWASLKKSSILAVGAILLFLMVVWSCVRLDTTIRIGADENYELSKALLAERGVRFYTDEWNDQPLLHTALMAEVLKHVSLSVMALRLTTVFSTVILLVSFYVIVLKATGGTAAAFAMILLVGSPGFVDLSSSCMVEIPALASAMAGLAALYVFGNSRGWLGTVIAGTLFGISLQIKLINAILLPEIGLILLIECAPMELASKRSILAAIGRECWRASAAHLAIFGVALTLTFAGINSVIPEGSYLLQLKQTWAAHFAATRSFEYGSPADYPYDWSIFWKSWDQTIPAAAGILVCLSQTRRNRWFLLPVSWFFLELIVFATHRPWWSYYYIHNAVPMAWCAGIGLEEGFRRCSWRSNRIFSVGFGAFLVLAGGWMLSRVYLQISTIRQSPQTYNSLVLEEIKRYKPFTEFLYAEEAVYSFHAGIPLPPKLGIVSLKRFWSGDLTNDKLSNELWRVKPGMILIGNDTRERPYRDLLEKEYSLTFEDSAHRLYARKDVAKQVKW